MKLLLKQKILSWFDSYNIYALPEGADPDCFEYSDEYIAYRVEGQLAWGHEFHIYDKDGRMLGRLSQEIFTFLPKFDLELFGEHIGRVEREFSLFVPSYRVDFRDWQVDGDFFGWDYSITDSHGKVAARISKELFHLGDTYVIDIPDERDALHALMVVLAIDAANCSGN